MACAPKFEPGVKWDCIKEIIAEVRGGGTSLATAKKLAWVIGCAIDQFDGETSTVQVEVPETADGCADRLSEIENQPSTQAVNPELIAILLKLLQLWLANR